MKNQPVIFRTAVSLLTGTLLLVALYLTSLYSYLLFHSLIELFTVTVAGSIFVIAWNARAYLNNNYLLFVGITSLFVALLDLVHTLAYQGMGVFADQSANPATQLWIAARYLQSLSLLMAPFFLGRKLRVHLQIAACALVTGFLFGSIFYWHIFPVAYVNGVGLTFFKKASEYVISFFFLTSIGLLLWKRDEFDPGVLRYLVLSLALTIGSELAFTSYVSVYGEANLVGHFLRLVAFYFMYKAIIETGLVNPYSILLRKLKLSESHLREDAAVLQARNEELDAYAHTVAHDLKIPLTIIIAASDLINTVPNLTPDEVKDSLQQIKSTAFEMDSIIDNLLLLSEVRSVDAPAEPVDMAKAVDHVQTRLSYMIRERHARVICSKTWPTAVGYMPWIEEVWANYLSNALKYGGKPPRGDRCALHEHERDERPAQRVHQHVIQVALGGAARRPRGEPRDASGERGTLRPGLRRERARRRDRLMQPGGPERVQVAQGARGEIRALGQQALAGAFEREGKGARPRGACDAVGFARAVDADARGRHRRGLQHLAHRGERLAHAVRIDFYAVK